MGFFKVKVIPTAHLYEAASDRNQVCTQGQKKLISDLVCCAFSATFTNTTV